ncbi:hypothetical protein ACMFMG_003813 [Clarireedia jacksonii]
MNHQPNSRPTRSRRSSPFISAQNNAKSSPRSFADTGAPKTFMQKWVEPQLPAPLPSFAEAGIERHGVVANMAPLGTRPSAKAVKSAAKPDTVEGNGNRRAAQGKKPEGSAPSLSVTPNEVIATPEPVPDIARRRSTSTKLDDSDYVPPSTPQRQTAARKSLPRSSVAPQSAGNRSEGQGVFAMASNQNTPISQHSPSSNYSRPFNAYQERDGGWDYRRGQMHKIVEEAVQIAVDEGRYPTAYALRTLYDDDLQTFGGLFEAMVFETASEAQRNEFYRIMKGRKKEGRLEKTAQYYFLGDGSDRPPSYKLRQRVFQPPAPPPVLYQPFLPVFKTVNPTYQTPYATPAQPPPPVTTNLPVAETSGGSNAERPSVVQSSSTPVSPKEEDNHAEYPNKKQKSNDFTATEDQTNGTLDASATKENVNGHQNADPSVFTEAPDGTSLFPELPERPRTGSVSSSSSLSSVDEQILEDDTYDSPMNFDHAPIDAGTTKSSEGFDRSKGKGTVGAGNHANASVSSETQSNAERSVNKNQPMRSEELSRAERYNFSTIEDNTNNKLSARGKSKTSSPVPPSFPAINLSRNSNNVTTNPNSQPRKGTSQTPSEMAPELVRTLSSSSSSVTSNVPVLKQPTGRKSQIVFKSKKDKAPTTPLYEEGEVIGQLKRKAREITNNSVYVHESFERTVPRSVTPIRALDSASDDDSVAIPTASATASGRPTKVRLLNKNERSTRRSTNNSNNNYDSEMSSPTVLSFQPDMAPGSLPNSRAGTPTTSNRPTRRGRPGTGLRVKTSPMKKKSGPSAGIPKASGERDSPLEKDTTGENDEYCAACGGNGQLVCCDGCTRSFHFKCIDPPLEQSDLLQEEEWFCTACLARHVPRSKEEAAGTFGLLLANLERKNPSAFHLPKSIREYFDNVKTGTEGEYEEGVVPKPKNNRAGYDEAPDYFRLKDNKGNPILCHHCHRAASPPNKAIIPCSYCSLSWHLDCLDIPLAKEPPPGKAWRCPAHVDDLLSLSGALGPAHKFRRIKGASAIKPAVSRGLKNNGYIEIENTPTEDEDEESGFFEQKEYGRVYRLPEEGIKLDFISRVHREFGEYSQRDIAKHAISRSQPSPSPSPSTPTPTQSTPFTIRSLDEQQAALNLAYLANSNLDIGITQNLIDTLIAEAPEPVIKLIAQGDASKLGPNARAESFTKSDKSSLIAMKELIQRVVGSADASDNDKADSEA